MGKIENEENPPANLRSRHLLKGNTATTMTSLPSEITIPSYNDSQPMPTTTNRQHFVVYNTPASAPASPTTTRNGHHNPSVIPQRITRSAPRQQPYHFSPLIPATNTSTPLSLRSISSNGSTLTTPISAASRRLSFTQSPEVEIQRKNLRQKSLAHIAHNWRNRANERGIRVTSSRESQYADDEGNCPPRPGVISWLLTPHRSGAYIYLFFTLSICLSGSQRLITPTRMSTLQLWHRMMVCLSLVTASSLLDLTSPPPQPSLHRLFCPSNDALVLFPTPSFPNPLSELDTLFRTNHALRTGKPWLL